MTAPTFSVVVPVYNAASTIAATTASVLAQTDGDFELLLLDDGSTDDSLARMLALAAVDERIHVVTHKNMGVALTRNLGAELAQGTLLAFLDADDLWHPEKLARHRALHDAVPASASFARIVFLEATHDALEHGRTRSTVPPGPLSVAHLLGENPVCTTSNLVVERAFFASTGGFRGQMAHAEDQEWLVRVAAEGARIVGIDETLVGYRASAGGLSADLGRMYLGWRDLAERYGASSDLRRAEAIYCRYLARRALRTGAAPGVALRLVRSGLRKDARAFLADWRRGGLTLAGAIAFPFFPAALRTRIFA